MDALVTCMYNGLSGTPYGGRLNRDGAYRESLWTIARTGVPITCFVPAADLPAQVDYFRRAPGEIEFMALELSEVPHHREIQRLKQAEPEKYEDIAWQERCVEIMWGKFHMLARVCSARPDAEHLYWIDAGLANANIISTKYIAEVDLINHRLSELGAAFTPKLFAGIRDFAGAKILALKTPQAHNPGIPEKYNARPYATRDALIAGLFGGRREQVSELCALFDEKVETILADGELFFEESILTGIYADHPEIFETFTFDTWYHEGWAGHDPNLTNFSQFFDRVLGTPPTARALGFPWNAP